MSGCPEQARSGGPPVSYRTTTNAQPWIWRRLRRGRVFWSRRRPPAEVVAPGESDRARFGPAPCPNCCKGGRNSAASLLDLASDEGLGSNGTYIRPDRGSKRRTRPQKILEPRTRGQPRAIDSWAPTRDRNGRGLLASPYQPLPPSSLRSAPDVVRDNSVASRGSPTLATAFL